MTLEVRPLSSPAKHPDRIQIGWGEPGSHASQIDASVDAWLSQIGSVSESAIDLVRVAAAAYVADRLTPRGTGFSRTIHLHVQLCHVSTWTPLLPDIEHLLGWVSGDEWMLTASAEKASRPKATVAALQEPRPDAVSLFSGGLDSFCGAVLRNGSALFVSHTDNPTVVAAQKNSWQWLEEAGVSGERVRVSLKEASGKREATTRTRALLFYALGVAVADAHSIERVEVPENGFTSLNVALGNDRGGALSTRSTHPWTMHLVEALLGSAGIPITFTNPYEWLTKGELVREAANHCEKLSYGVAQTLSCAKLDGRTYKGGNPNRNCGLCVACLTRRASVLSAGIKDRTPYLATTLTGAALDQLHSRRELDVRAVMSRATSNMDEYVLLENGPYPDDYDFDAAVDLCRRGFNELATLARRIRW